ncbi:hypothetical protein RJZ56_003511 [Blastomyces dermatitidis]|uniref:Uncharacterized protein n=1 Tax=Ajellomyces dermatitidis (strain ER-3 / ATCC MYA-2586) TaxID=559297 RepID=A0ABP2EP74_AJEDR|nr:uncharacterized protein BDCG_00803 [Blastomyces dermatitidis ER-3]XP_045279307.1 hypothetical protein, variant [Blastomyces dermatitidis ER-3]EEQ83998.1 hypothetical protein BDCG_00803 [Blastomyces dermatitidis ER-3]OAS99579.1 hypothetical protein, variant [Blastomyces dermatitidis ER-3]
MEATRAHCLRSLSKQCPRFGRSTRESRRLSSFLNGHEPAKPIGRSAQSSTPNRLPKNPNGPSTSSKDTDEHLSSILDHPLFRIVPAKPLPRRDRNDSNAQGAPNVRKKLAEDPLGLLDELIASGRADHNALHCCLRAHGLPSPSSKPPNAIGPSSVGSRIVAWYSATDIESRMLFFGSRPTMGVVMPYMVVDRLQNTVIEWVKMVSNGPSSGGLTNSLLPTQRLCLMNMLREFVTAEIKYGEGIQSSLRYYIRLCRILPPGDKFIGSKHDPFRASLRTTGSELASWISTHCRSPEVQEIPVALFDEFRMLSDQLSSSRYFWGACLPLYHPTNPDVNPALTYMKHRPASRGIRIQPTMRKHLLRLSLDAAQLCLEQKLYSEASWLLSHAKQFIAGEEEPTSEQSSERSNPQTTLGSSPLLGGICLE